MKVICVRNPPNAQFTMNRNSSCGPGNAIFTNTSPANSCQGDKYTWKVTYSDPLGCGTNQTPAWQFANGSTLNTASPEIQFNIPGKYVIRLTVTANAAGLACPESFKEDTFYVFLCVSLRSHFATLKSQWFSILYVSIENRNLQENDFCFA